MQKFFAATALVATLIAIAAPARASTIFDLSPTTSTTVRGADSGPGQGVSVATSTDITGFSFFANLPNGGDVKFMIWDATNSSLLFSQTDSFAASNTQSWIGTTPINFNLAAGDTYWFGLIADNNLDVGYIYPPGAYSSNGLTAISTGNSNYQTFADPTFVGSYAAAEIGLQISGSAVSSVPEPSTWALIIIGFVGLGFVSYRKGRPAICIG